jgi:hypothetical protein
MSYVVRETLIAVTLGALFIAVPYGAFVAGRALVHWLS